MNENNENSSPLIELVYKDLRKDSDVVSGVHEVREAKAFYTTKDGDITGIEGYSPRGAVGMSMFEKKTKDKILPEVLLSLPDSDIYTQINAFFPQFNKPDEEIPDLDERLADKHLAKGIEFGSGIMYAPLRSLNDQARDYLLKQGFSINNLI